MTAEKAQQLLDDVLDRGFDNSRISYADDDEQIDGVRVRCSQCEALTINGIACHETGCPNAAERPDFDAEDEDC